MLVDSDL